MSLWSNIKNAGRALTGRGAKSSDIKAAVPMFPEVSGGQSAPFFQDWQQWDAAIEQALSGWRRTEINYAAEVGDLRFSVLVMAAIRWAGINLASGQLGVVELGADKKEKPIEDHPFTMLMDEPSPESDLDTLWKQFAASWIIGGEYYALIARDGANRIKEFWFEPNPTIRPRWENDPVAGLQMPNTWMRNPFPEDETANTFIGWFEILRGGQWIPWPKRDVFRVYDLLDPITRRGMNGMQGLLRTIFTDQEREQYQALLLKNCGVTPIALAPKASGTHVDAKALAEQIHRRTRGDERGKATVFTEPMEVLNFASDYSADAMEKIAHISESRVAAAIGISVQSLQFLVAQLSSTYNNLKTFLERDFRQWVMPTQETFRKAAERQILRDMDSNKRHVLRFDYSAVPALQRDRLETARETDLLVRARVIDQAEARERHGYAFDEAIHKGVFYPVPAIQTTISPIDATGEPMNEPTKAISKVKPDDLDEGAEWWKESAGVPELIDATGYVNGKAVS